LYCLGWNAKGAAAEAPVTLGELNVQIAAARERKLKIITLDNFGEANKHHLQLKVLEEQKIVLLKALAPPTIEPISATTGAENATWSWWWCVDVYVNDSSGWIIQRTSAG
jgi:hypothetical protein